jgi:hypothetical protein
MSEGQVARVAEGLRAALERRAGQRP